MRSTELRHVAFEHVMFVPVFGAVDPMPEIDCDVSRTGADGITAFFSIVS